MVPEVVDGNVDETDLNDRSNSRYLSDERIKETYGLEPAVRLEEDANEPDVYPDLQESTMVKNGVAKKSKGGPRSINRKLVDQFNKEQ